MPAVPSTQITTLREFTEWIESRMKVAGHLWYRGCGELKHKLTPSLYRHPTITAVKELIQLEAQIMTRFRERALPYLERSVAEDWDFLFLMQHYGVPTRLLDWTETLMWHSSLL